MNPRDYRYTGPDLDEDDRAVLEDIRREANETFRRQFHEGTIHEEHRAFLMQFVVDRRINYQAYWDERDRQLDYDAAIKEDLAR